MTRQRYHLQYDEWTYESFPTHPRVKRWNYTHCHNLWNQQTLRVSTKICEVHHVHPYKQHPPIWGRFFLGNTTPRNRKILLFLLFFSWKGREQIGFVVSLTQKYQLVGALVKMGNEILPLKGIFSYSGCAINAPHSYLFQKGGHLAKNRADLSNFLVWYLREQ